MVQLSSRRQRSETGAIAIVVVVFAVAMFALAAIVVDAGLARDTRRQAQNASDASALAAGNALYLAGNTANLVSATAAAKDYALQNYGVSAGEWTSCEDPQHLPYVSADTECISFDHPTRPTEVRVKAPLRSLQTQFARAISDTTTMNVAAAAHAQLDPGGASRCGLCVTGDGLHDLQNGDATVAGADIHFNGSVSVSNNGLVATDGDITVEDSATGPLSNYDPDPVTGAAPIRDPLAHLSLPPDLSGLQQESDPCVDGPGLYGGQNLRSATCTLQPGLYVVAGPGAVWDLAGNDHARLEGAGVTIYLTCGTPMSPSPCAEGESGATIDASGNGTLALQAPTSGPLEGLTIVYDRNNTSTLRLTGGGSGNFTGTIYAASGTLQMNGNGCASTYNSLIVVDDLEMNGNPSCLNAAYSADENVELPPGGLHLSR